jgi:hypothetical protein
MANAWIQFLSAYRKRHPKLSMKQAMKSASVEWAKKKGGSAKAVSKSKKKRK